MAELAGSITLWPKETMEQYRWLDEYLQKQPATQKEFQPAWQAYKYLLGGKMYAYIGVNDKNGRPIITLKLEPAHSEMLRRDYADIVPGYYMNKLHWSTAYLDGAVPRDILADMASAAHKLVLASLSKKARQQLPGG